MSDKSELSKEWLRDFYNQVGREVSLARESQLETHNWTLTLAGGAIAAVWALGGKNFQFPTESSLIVILILAPLIFRFFVRSCLEYQIFHRWISIRNALDVYFYIRDTKNDQNKLGENPEIYAMQSLKEHIRLYYFQWKQPRSTLKMIWDNLQLAYGWPVILITVLLIFGFIYQKLTMLIIGVLIIVIPWMVFEVINFIRYFRGRYQEPTKIISRGKIV